jgi:hypothetical protein
MPGEAQDLTPPPLPSVFISYSSSDRAAARLLRDCLTAAGLEVWLDEDELGGGEAWDAKIRNQIRTCTYFMPVISASTEVRREGYFRREWRLAVERTLDFADDVMFLVPVVIDDTRDIGARVPEKFFTVQWLRVPGGQATPALKDLAKKLARGEAVAVAPTAPLVPPAAENSRKKSGRAEPPPFPTFPAFPEHGNRARFLYDLVLWFGHLMHSFWGHLPRWMRVIAAIVIVFNVIGMFSGRNNVSFGNNSKKPKTESAASADPGDKTRDAEIAGEVGKALGEAGTEMARQARNHTGVPAALQSLFNTTAEGLQGGRALAVVTFSGEGDTAGEYAKQVFDLVYEKLATGPRVGLSPIPFTTEPTDMDCLERGVRMKSRFVLTGYAKAKAGETPGFTVRLFDVKLRTFTWTETFDTAVTDAKTVARRITTELAGRTRPAPGASTAPAIPAAPAPPKDKEPDGKDDGKD